MSAFGPYAGVETIDFEKLKDKNIFLITGPTGAGKTTIFDALSYALFGEASGSSRDKDSLRSDFALPETVTYIELEFGLRGKVYKITRFPQQERKKARGEGFVSKNSEAHLILPDGDIITKVNNVDEKISGILGINKNQFRQIVMLPQGEFRKLLEADSAEREGIFRKIFGTETFEIIQRKLDEQKKSIYKKIEETKTKRDTHVKHIEPGEDELLIKLVNAKDLNITEIINETIELIKKDERNSKEIDEEVKEFRTAQEKVQKSIVEGEEINRKLKEKYDLEKQYELDLLREEQYKQKQIQLEKGRRAREVKLVEDSLRERENNLKLKEIQYKGAEQKLKEAESNLLLWEKQLKEQEGKEGDRKKLSDSINTLKNQQEKVKDYELKSSKIIELREELKNKDNYLKKLKLTIADEKNKLEKTNKDLLESQKAETEKEKLDKAVYEKELVLKDMRLLYKKTGEYIDTVDKHREISKSFEEFEKKYIGYKNSYELLEDNFRRGQAGLLAKDLKEGIPCPVCGATNHPKLAQLIDGVPTEEKLKEVKVEFEKLREEREKKLQVLSDLNGIIKSSKELLMELKDKQKELLGELSSIPEKDMLNYLVNKGTKTSEELNVLKEDQVKLVKLIEKKGMLEDTIIKLGNSIKEKEDLLQVLEKEYTEFYGKVESEEKLLISIEKEIPQEIRSSNKLLLKIKELENALIGLENAYKKAQENYNKAKTDHASSLADKDGKAKNVQEAIKEVAACQYGLDNKIKDTGFEDYNQYALFRMAEEKITLLEKDIVEYYQNLKSLKDRCEKARKDVEGLSEISLEKLKESLNDLKLQQQKLEEREKTIYSRVNNNKKALKEIQNIGQLIKDDEEKYSVVGELARVANGDNRERITFERYVLAAYFDEIIKAANIRLNKMATGRFVLKRKEEKGKGRKQEGLELEVFDNYTGKSRHVKTLSGGESFKASLALALGLADVVQSYAGGISLDTMFVDEGFGTLDPESLDNAIQCLIDLQKGGRLVGIISHVPELKERIDARLEITPAKEGSKAKFIV